jgi:hypothetical protein
VIGTDGPPGDQTGVGRGLRRSPGAVSLVGLAVVVAVAACWDSTGPHHDVGSGESAEEGLEGGDACPCSEGTCWPPAECATTPARIICPDGTEKVCKCEVMGVSHRVPTSCP